MIHVTMHLDSGDAVPQKYTFHVPAIVGRSKLADVTILHPLISRKHCEMTESNDGRLAIRDLDSLNGTYVGETRIKQSVLSPGDHLTLGPFTYRIQYSADTTEDAATEPIRPDRPAGTSAGTTGHAPPDQPTAYGGTPHSTTIESTDSPDPPDGPTADDDAKATVTGPPEPPDVGQRAPDRVSGDDPALQDFLKRLP